jgi:NADH-quinone oxidoreductase subunit A
MSQHVWSIDYYLGLRGRVEVADSIAVCYSGNIPMPIGYIPILGFALLSAAFPVMALFVARFLRPTAPNQAKLEAYECGIRSEGGSRGRFSVRFYVVAMLFVIFDVEMVFLFPWAVRYKQYGWVGLAEAGVFLAFLVVGYLWILGKRVLSWA